MSVTSWTGGMFRSASGMWKQHFKLCFLCWKRSRFQDLSHWHKAFDGAYGTGKRIGHLMRLKPCSDLVYACAEKQLAERMKRPFQRLHEQWSCAPTWNTIVLHSSIMVVGVVTRRQSQHHEQKDWSMMSRTPGWARSAGCVGPCKARIGWQR